MIVILDINPSVACNCRMVYNLDYMCRVYGIKGQYVGKKLCRKIFKEIYQYYEGDTDVIYDYIAENCKNKEMAALFKEVMEKGK